MECDLESINILVLMGGYSISVIFMEIEIDFSHGMHAVHNNN